MTEEKTWQGARTEPRQASPNSPVKIKVDTVDGRMWLRDVRMPGYHGDLDSDPAFAEVRDYLKVTPLGLVDTEALQNGMDPADRERLSPLFRVIRDLQQLHGYSEYSGFRESHARVKGT